MNLLSEFQEWVTNISEKNFEERFVQIKESIYYENKLNFSLFHEIICAIQIRPKQLNIYSNLIFKLIESDETKKSDFLKYIFEPLNKNHQTSNLSKYYLLKHILDEKQLDFHIILPFIKEYLTYQKKNIKALLNLLVFSSFLIENDRELFNEIISDIKESSFSLSAHSSYYDFVQNIDEYLENDCNKLLEYIEFGSLKQSLPCIIKNDDIEKLQEFIANFNGNETKNDQETQNQFDPNSSIGKLPFEFCPFARKEPTVLMYCLLYNSTNCFQYLVSNYELTNDSVDNKYNSIESYAVASGNIDLISKYFLNDEFNLLQSLQTAAQFRQISIFQFILDKYKDQKDDDYYQQLTASISVCASSNSASLLDNLLSDETNPNKPQLLALLQPIILNCHFILFKEIFSKIKDSLTQDVINLLFFLACSRNQIDIAKYLIDNCHASPNFSDGNSTPLEECINNGFNTLFDYILSLNDIDLNLMNNQNESPLICAAKENQPEFIRKLIQTEKIDINIRDENGLSALFYCIKNTDIEDIDLLLSKGSLIEYEDISALHIAAENENSDVLRHLLPNNDIDINRKDNEGKTALHICANSSSNLIENAKVLIENGADVNSIDDMGSTPLHYAVGNENIEMVKYLISLPNIDKTIVDKSGWTPIRIAELQAGPDSDLVKLLQ